ncbi:hypothetical protein [uncultured Stenotrophomonas sp.]|uniref:hypothetical protein n=1 Tax=uncultured Stenotrophomonas sp. TaxID=165438 RepID=UPI0025F3E0CB|nr:hypothetical protein [uncultured Stenotrophomonas sp.]
MRSFASLIRVLLLAVALSAAYPLSATPIVIVGPSLEDAFEDSDVVPGLKRLLGPDYAAFRRNFDESATPVPLKSGGLLLAGWRLGFADSYGAVVVLHPSGSLDAAYYNAGARTPRYFSNSDQPHHRALRAWARQYIGDAPQVFPGGWDSSAVVDLPSEEDQAAMRAVAAAIWSPTLAQGWNMNTEVGRVLGEATKYIMDCSAAFSLVPKPVGWVPGWAYVATTSVQIVAYVTGASAHRVYRTCVIGIGTASRQRPFIELASAEI